MTISAYPLIITLNVNGLNAPIKRQGGGWFDKRTRPMYVLLTETCFRAKDICRWKVKGWKKIFHVHRNDKKAGISILISNKIDFKTMSVTEKEDHYINGSIEEEAIMLVNIYAPNTGDPKWIKQILTDMKREINNNTIIVREFNTPLTSMNRLSRQKMTH